MFIQHLCHPECSERIPREDLVIPFCEIAFSPFGRRTRFFTSFRMTNEWSIRTYAEKSFEKTFFHSSCTKFQIFFRIGLYLCRVNNE